MTNQDCENLHPLLSLYLEEKLSPSEKEHVVRHMSECEDARAQLEEYRALRRALLMTPEPVPPVDLHERILRHVYQKPGSRPSSMGPDLRPWWTNATWWGLSAAAVGMVLFFNLFSDGRNLLRKSVSSASPQVSEGRQASAPVLKEETATAPRSVAVPPAERVVAAPTLGHRPRVFRMQDDSQDDGLLQQDNSLFASQVSRRALQSTVAYGDEPPQAAPQPVVRNVMVASRPKATAKTMSATAPVAMNSKEAAPGGLLGEGEPQRFWSGEQGLFPEQHVECVKDPTALMTYWQLLASGQPAPQVDFQKNFVALIFLGTRPTTGYTIAMEGVSEGNDAVTVLWRERAPSPDQTTAQVVTHPWAMQVVPKTDKPVVFIKR